MLRFLGLLILRITGWRVVGNIPQEIKKCVVVMAPHTSNWDFIIGRIGFWYLGVKVKFLIKKEIFFFPIGYLVKGLGGIPVDRSKKTNLVSQVSNHFETKESFVLAVTPEGTRSLNYHWKKGFYHIATQKKVAIVLGFLDYKKKEGGIGPVIYPSGDYEKDLKVIEEFYMDKTARFPENYNLSPQNRKK